MNPPLLNLVIITAPLLLCGLLYFEKQNQTRPKVLFKAALSSLFVLTALLQPYSPPGYRGLILTGLILGLGGDVCLALPGRGALKAGLAAFLAGHVCYVLAFIGLARAADWLSLVQIVWLGLSGGVFWRLRPHLGAMRGPVAVYVVVITAMLAGAWAAFNRPDLKAAGAWSIFVGALCFYLSDVFVARDRFVKKTFLNRLLGLPLYYTAQYLLAFSVGLTA